jgi:ADP-ribose pyrophosphatase YjhB (NUDIX family)
MQREYASQPLVGVGAIIVREQRVALIRRGKPPLMGEWSIPGGMLELGETLRQGAEREAKEETGLEVRAGEMLGVFERIVPDAESRTQYHYVLIDFLCEAISGDLCAGHDAAEARWFVLDEVLRLPLAQDTSEVIRRGLEQCR